MSLIIQKFGGSSLASPSLIKQAANRVNDTKRKGHDVIVVVSAMKNETDRLLSLARQISPYPNHNELDMITSTGEQVSAALMALTLNQMGYRSRSLLGHQIQIQTDASAQHANIKSIDTYLIQSLLEKSSIPVVAGYQGVDGQGKITTLGRGGSDTTAVALAAAFGSVPCEINTDVDGIYTTDPSLYPLAKKFSEVSYAHTYLASKLGAQVLHDRSIAMGMRYQIPIHVRSTFSSSQGTMVVDHTASLQSIAIDPHVVQIVFSPNCDPAIVLQCLSEAKIPIDMIVNGPEAPLSLTTKRREFTRMKGLFPSKDYEIHDSLSKVSVVGGEQPNLLAGKMVSILNQQRIKIRGMGSGANHITCLISQRKLKSAARALHEGFGMDSQGEN